MACGAYGNQIQTNSGSKCSFVLDDVRQGCLHSEEDFNFDICNIKNKHE